MQQTKKASFSGYNTNKSSQSEVGKFFHENERRRKGSGKTTLLKVIAGRGIGEFTGELTLNERPLSRRLFDSVSVLINFKQPLVKTMTIYAVLKFHAEIAAYNLTDQEVDERLTLLVQEFDLTAYKDVLIQDLNEATRRRLLICMHLVRDPILIVLDEPTEGLDALSSYQLMYSLSLYIKRTQRLALVATRFPRSVLYQFFTRITILFHGEIIYSGLTNELPQYFQQIGLPCPLNENPAIYYLSFATVDRKMTERYRETREQAPKLIDLFKKCKISKTYQPMIKAPCQTALRQPSGRRQHCCYKFFVLLRYSFRAIYSSSYTILLRLLLLPILTLLLCSCGTQFSIQNKDWWWPQNTAASVIIFCTMFSLVAIFLTVMNDSIICGQLRQDVLEGLYSDILRTFSFLFASAPNDLLTFSASILIILRHCDALSNLSWNFIWSLSLPLWFCYQYSQLLTLLVLFYTHNADYGLKILIVLCFGTVVCAGSSFIPPRTFLSRSDWRHILLYIDFYRYVFSFMNFKFIADVTIADCTRDEHSQVDNTPLEKFCRWSNGSAFLNEQYPEMLNYSSEAFNCYFIGLFVIIVAAVGLLCCCYSKRTRTLLS